MFHSNDWLFYLYILYKLVFYIYIYIFMKKVF